MCRGLLEGPLVQLSAGNTDGKESIKKKLEWGALCAEVKRMGLGFCCFYDDAALKCDLLREQHVTHVYLVTSNRSRVKSWKLSITAGPQGPSQGWAAWIKWPRAKLTTPTETELCQECGAAITLLSSFSTHGTRPSQYNSQCSSNSRGTTIV